MGRVLGSGYSAIAKIPLIGQGLAIRIEGAGAAKHHAKGHGAGGGRTANHSRWGLVAISGIADAPDVIRVVVAVIGRDIDVAIAATCDLGRCAIAIRKVV